MRRLIIDPSSTVLGWVVMDDCKPYAAGDIDARKVDYADKFPFIVEELRKVYIWYTGINEIVMEQAVKYGGKKIPALEVACKAIRDWAKTLKGVKLYQYYAATWKAALLGSPKADKQDTFYYVRAALPKLPIDKLSEHVVDAMAIGIYHNRTMEIEGVMIDIKHDFNKTRPYRHGGKRA